MLNSSASGTLGCRSSHSRAARSSPVSKLGRMYQQSRWGGQESTDSSGPEPRVCLARDRRCRRSRSGSAEHRSMRSCRTGLAHGTKAGLDTLKLATQTSHGNATRARAATSSQPDGRGARHLPTQFSTRLRGQSPEVHAPSGRATPALSTTRTRTFGRLAATSTAARSGITANAVASASASVAVGAITETLR